MSIKIQCPTCSQVIEAPYEMSGQQTACPTCGATLLIPIVEKPVETETPAAATTQLPSPPKEKPHEKDLNLKPADPLDDLTVEQLIEVLESRYENFWLVRYTDETLNQVLDFVNTGKGGSEIDYQVDVHHGLTKSSEEWQQVIQFHVMKQLQK